MKGEHMQNKKSVWSTILLIATFLMLASIVVSIVAIIVSLPTMMEMARSIMMEEAGDKLDEASIELALQITKTTIIVGLVFAVIIGGLEVLGGFLFSLKGRWGVFCIVVGVLGVFFEIFDLTDLGNGQNTVGTIEKRRNDAMITDLMADRLMFLIATLIAGEIKASAK